jgi:Transposase DDE domain
MESTSQEQNVSFIEDFLASTLRHVEVEEPSKKAGRPRVLPALALWAGVLVCLLRGWSSQREIWRLLSVQGIWHFPRYSLSDEAVYKRLEQESQDSLKRMFEAVTASLYVALSTHLATSQASWCKFASGVFALDEMTLDKLFRRLPSLRQDTAVKLAGKVTALFDIRKQVWRGIAYQEHPQQNERKAAREMLDFVPKGSLLLTDLGYFGFQWFDDLTQAGLYFISRLRQKTTFDIIEVLYQDDKVLDALVWLGTYRADRARFSLRLVQYDHNGMQRSFITNVLDPRLLSLADIASCYARRWDIEMMFNLIKTHLKLHTLMSSKLNVILHQVFAVFTIAQVILGLRLDIANQAKVDPFDVSLDLLVRWVPRLAADGLDPVATIVERGRLAGFIRPSSRLNLSLPSLDLARYNLPNTFSPLERLPRYAGKT